MRKAFKMKLYPNSIKAYIQRHNPIWKELEEVLKIHGVHNYSIFFDSESHLLFGYAELESEEKWNAIANTQICQDWWAHMADLMETNEDNSPVSLDLEEVFYLK